MLHIKNIGPLIEETNYWGTEHARRGFVYLSINAGVLRALVPASSESMLADMRTAKIVVLSRGPWPQQRKSDALELMFDDGTGEPFALHLLPEMIDRLPDDADHGRKFLAAIYTADGPQFERPCVYRRVPQLPFLKPWVLM